MSVINKMLRDLDQRQAHAPVSSAPPGQRGGRPAGTAVVADFAQALPPQRGVQRRARPIVLVLAVIGLVLVVGASWWWASQRTTPAVAAVSLASPAIAVVAVVALPPAPVASAAVAAVLLADRDITPSALVPAPAPAASTPARLAVPPAAPVVVAVVATTASIPREPAVLGLRMDNTLTPRRLTERATVFDRMPAPSSELPKGPTPNDALERAQMLWNSGAREAAIDLLQDAVVVAERVAAGGNSVPGNRVLLPLVRELTRMQLAESRHAAVWDVLARLEPQLGNAPDLWAIRGNAAQRLGRHQDSVRAYMAALQSQPNEPRWLLGAAVSLAALGQTSSSAEMADKARALGGVSPEVLAYLRQMGVPLKEK